jgi:predicted Rossmann-fold nucleotide-binding protein
MLHDKPVVIFNYQGYWDPLIALMKNIIEQQFAKAEVATYYHVVDKLEDIIDVLGYE